MERGNAASGPGGILNEALLRLEKQKKELDRTPPLSDTEVLLFFKNGHAVTRGLLDKDVVKNLKKEVVAYSEASELEALRHQVKVLLDVPPPQSLDECTRLLSEKGSTIDFPFLQHFHLWKRNEAVREIALSPVLGRIAAQYLGVSSVRLYQDSLFIKRFGDRETRWHSDLHMSPFDTNDFVTCWIPLDPVPRQEDGGTSLSFATASHRDFALPFWSDPMDGALLDDRYEIADYGAFDCGDASWHHGFCLHSAPANDLPQTRYALSISYVRDQARLLNQEGHIRYPDNEDEASYAAWINDLGWGATLDHPLCPIVYAEEVSAEEAGDEEQE